MGEWIFELYSSILNLFKIKLLCFNISLVFFLKSSVTISLNFIQRNLQEYSEVLEELQQSFLKNET